MQAAVLGSPIAHSLSPVLHRAAYAALGLDGWSYQAIECDERRLPAVLAGCGPDWAGLSLTMPLKRAVLDLLDAAEPLVTEVGAANTVTFDGGARHGHNTDVPGMLTALAEAGLPAARRAEAARAGATGAAPGADGGTDRLSVLILGAGATACSAVAAARALGVTEVTVAARDPARAADVTAAAGRLGVTLRLAPFGAPGPPAPGLLICTAPARAADDYAERLARGALTPGCILDVVYDPWPTPLAVAAARAGVPVAGGFALLLHQAARQVELMTGRAAPVAAMRAAGLDALAARV